MSYKFYPPQRSSAPGYPQMEMIINESPTTSGTDNRNLERVKLSMSIKEIHGLVSSRIALNVCIRQLSHN
jgi:hypothetical protein